MQLNDIIERVRGVVAEHMGRNPEDVTAQTRLASDLGADSLDTIGIIIWLEDEFSVDLPDEKAEPMTDPSLQELAELVHKHMQLDAHGANA